MVFMVQQPIWKMAVHVQPRQPMAEIALAVYSNIPIAITAIATSISASRWCFPCPPMCGIFEVRFPGNRPSRYFYWDDLPSRRLRPEILTREQALELAKDPSESVATLDRGPRLEDHVTLSELGRIDEAF